MTYYTRDPVGDAQRHEQDEESLSWHACLMTASKNGHGYDAAMDCDSGSVGCPDCPWRKA